MELQHFSSFWTNFTWTGKRPLIYHKSLLYWISLDPQIKDRSLWIQFSFFLLSDSHEPHKHISGFVLHFKIRFINSGIKVWNLFCASCSFFQFSSVIQFSNFARKVNKIRRNDTLRSKKAQKGVKGMKRI